jgi:hypothetical protein
MLRMLETCEDCAVGKEKQKSTNKQRLQGIKNPGERLYIHIGSIRGESYGGFKFWALIIDNCKNYCWSDFLSKKSALKKRLHVEIVQKD